MDNKCRNRAILRERRRGKYMLNGVGGLRIRWNLVAQPDEFIKPPWKKEEERITCRKKEESGSCYLNNNKKAEPRAKYTLLSFLVNYSLVCFSLNVKNLDT